MDMSKIKITGIVVAVLLVPFAIAFYSIFLYRATAPVMEDARREVFQNTQSYVHGKVQMLAKYKVEYDKADVDGKLAIVAVIRNQYAEFDDVAIKADGLRTFLVHTRGF